jgi:adhesin transport system outer membrane protein
MQGRKLRKIVYWLALCLAAPSAAAVTMSEVAQQAVLRNPEVQARWNTFNASMAQQDVARGGYFPRLDVVAGAGREHLVQPNQADLDYNRHGAGAILSQMLFDGFFTRSEVRRLGYSKLVRYYELLDASQSAALEASRAYFDVLRYRRLVKLAEENYAQHRILFDQMVQRAQAGVARRVDLEQAGGRLALAESNLLTETSNLHDVSARYQRIVGSLPPEDMAEPPLLQAGVPATGNAAMEAAILNNPSIAAAVENIRSAQMNVEGRRSEFMPKLDFRARQDITQNKDGVLGEHQDRVVEVVLNYNLFRGGSDMAASRQATSELSAAKDLRDKACRDVRQTLAIAFNDTQRLAEQLRYLDAHQLAQAKVREAYRKQFDIGQRTLLDLLDSENELFQARRSFVNAQVDHGIAYARTQASTGTLLAALNLRRLDTPTLSDMGDEAFPVDPSSACPPEVPVMESVDKAAVLARALAANPPPAAVPAPAVAPVVPADEQAIQKALKDWLAAWSAKNADVYLAFYAPSFEPDGKQSRADWERQRRQRLGKSGAIEVTAEDVTVKLEGPNDASSQFRQSYHSGDFSDVVTKTLHWKRGGGRWLIVRETAGK